jgi:hypothetical protein
MKVVKMPGEYDVYDSDEEEKIKGRFIREPQIYGAQVIFKILYFYLFK